MCSKTLFDRRLTGETQLSKQPDLPTQRNSSFRKNNAFLWADGNLQFQGGKRVPADVLASFRRSTEAWNLPGSSLSSKTAYVFCQTVFCASKFQRHCSRMKIGLSPNVSQWQSWRERSWRTPFSVINSGRKQDLGFDCSNIDSGQVKWTSVICVSTWGSAMEMRS